MSSPAGSRSPAGSPAAGHPWHTRAGRTDDWPHFGPWPRRGPGSWLALLIGVPQVLFTWLASQDQPDRRPLDALGLTLLVASAAALVARIRAPVATLVVATAATAAYYGAGYPYGPAFLALLVATVGAVFRGHRRATWLVLGAGFAGFLLLDRAVSGEWLSAAATVTHAVWICAIIIVAELVRARADRFAEARRSMQEVRRRHASEERLLLARELHDVLAHNVSLINVQASTALHLFDDDPERARAALAAIKAASRETLQELRATVGSLRAEADPAPRAPTAGLDRLEALVTQTEEAGLRVDLRRLGVVRPLPPHVDQAAYRIVQEALTNVRRHAVARTATVALDYGAEVLGVQVIDDGRGSPPDGVVEGHGMVGMRERAEALGGSLSAGPREPGGFAISATLPFTTTDPEEQR